jgi:NADH:ubiquinone oxidoreductase subunit
MDIGARLYTFFKGTQVGTDSAGNRYFIERRARAPGVPLRRWVLYPGRAAAASVPAGWYAWLHFPTGGVAPDSHRQPQEGGT